MSKQGCQNQQNVMVGIYYFFEKHGSYYFALIHSFIVHWTLILLCRGKS